MIKMKFFNYFIKKSQVKDHDELELLMEFCGGDMWFLIREYKKRHPEKSIGEIRAWLGVDDSDLDIKDAWNNELFFKAFGKNRDKVKAK